jgi:hypothetical protein
MSHLKIGSTITNAPEVYELGNDGLGALIRLYAYISRYRTAGFVPPSLFDAYTTPHIRSRFEALGILTEGPSKWGHGYWLAPIKHVKVPSMPGVVSARYDLVRSAAGRATREAIQARLDFYGGLCWICRTAPAQAMDHVKPLAAGGSNWPANLRPACTSCNSRKGATWPWSRA